jgi:hypothetical protein
MRTYKVTMDFTPREYQVWTNALGPGHHKFNFEIVEDEPIVAAPPAPAKERKPRRTKAQMAADTPKQMMGDEAPTKPLFPWKDGEMNKAAAE